jgi:hypothetical protein
LSSHATGSMLLGVLLGFAVALIYCWFSWVRPLQSHLDASEKSLQEWAKVHLRERENAGAIQGLSVNELRTWVAAVDEQNRLFTELERHLHQQELELAGPPTSYLLIAACVVLGVVALMVYWLRDGNQVAATTLENLAVLSGARLATSLGPAAREPNTLLKAPATTADVGATATTALQSPHVNP